MPDSMSAPRRRASGTAKLLAAIGWAATVGLVLGPLLAWLRLVPPLAGFLTYVAAGGWAAVASLLGVIAAARGFGMRSGVVVALLASSVFVASVVLAVAGPGHRGAPRINDFTTDTTDPPAFRFAATLPANHGRDLAYPASFAAVQATCCDDLKTVRLAAPPPEALRLAEDVARHMPAWTVTAVDPATGTLEAVAESRLFGFQDDVVVRVRPTEIAGSAVDVRSKSRDGQGDMGVNAERIRAFTHALRDRAGQRS